MPAAGARPYRPGMTSTTTRRPAGGGFIEAAGSGARSTHPLATVPLTQIFYLIGLLPGVLLLGPALERMLGEETDPGIAIVLNALAVPLNYAFPYAVLWMWLRYYERRSFASTGFGFDRRTLPGLGWGTLLAIGYILAWIGVSLAAGTARFDRFADFSNGGAAGVLLVGALVLVMRIVMVGIEEQLFRGWMLQAVGVRWGRAAGVLLSSACFSLFHFFFIGNLLLPGTSSHEAHWVLMLNIFLWAVFAALVTLVTGDLWAATAFHAAALILPSFLLTVALPAASAKGWPGTEDASGLLIVTVTDPTFYTGGAGFAGLFEGLPATAVLAVLAAAAWLRLRRKEHAAR